MLTKALQTKRCILVCGGGGVGKTTIAASLGIAATHFRKRVLVVTIDPAKRLAEAFGYSSVALEQGGAPLLLSKENAKKLEIPEDAELSVGILNPKYVLEEILVQVLTEEQRVRLKKTMLYGQLSEMIYGLQEYTAYEWVTRMLNDQKYDLIILDTPPAFHAKDFFNAPEKITRLMESKVFQLFKPRKTWFSGLISFGWIEKLLGERLYRESRVFFELFAVLRDQILDRCKLLSKFFEQDDVEVIAVATPESSALHELEGLTEFLKSKKISLQTVVVNQVEVKSETSTALENLSSEILAKLNQIEDFHAKKSKRAEAVIQQLRTKNPARQIIPVPMVYAEDGFEILRQNSKSLRI